MRGLHRIASLPKRWLLGTFQGAVGNERLNGSLAEYTLRFNRRKSHSRGFLFYRLLEPPVRPITDPRSLSEKRQRATAATGPGKWLLPLSNGTMKLVSIVRCPHCGGKSEEEMPQNACVYFFECPACGTRLQPESGDCCVFCSYGSVACPPVQEQRDRR
jgi:hypothetical protein